MIQSEKEDPHPKVLLCQPKVIILKMNKDKTMKMITKTMRMTISPQYNKRNSPTKRKRPTKNMRVMTPPIQTSQRERRDEGQSPPGGNSPPGSA